ncbi:GntR family transcriptional regulator [Paenibacillus sp. 2TAB19]|uniref:GntR family transcriptional regulator n=1 Tax=Paenibacillus sp. 2TAB19 TaxID=3233003 RepID=UPI003F9DD923
MASQSLVNTAYTKLRERIVGGNLMPGTLLSENELAEELQMSRTPVRNAITHLESEGFVVALKNRGVLVKEVSGKELLDMYEAILALVVYAIDVRSERENHIPMELLKEYLNRQFEAEQAGDYYTYINNSMLFMRTLVSSINNTAMTSQLDMYVDKITMASYINFKLTPHIKHYSANQLNKSIYDALLAGDEEQARKLAKGAFIYARSRMFDRGQF